MAASNTHLIDIDPVTGEYIQGWPRIKRSIEKILRTRLRTRLMRLWWGSEFLDIQDKPGNQETIMDGIMAAVTAINSYEPEFKVTTVVIKDLDSTGSMTVIVEGFDVIEKAAKRVQVTL